MEGGRGTRYPVMKWHISSWLFTKLVDFLPSLNNKKLCFLLISWSSKNGNYIFQSVNPFEINLKPRFSIKSGYYIVPSPSTALVFMSLETWYSPCSNSTSTDHLDKIERCRSVVSEKIPFDIINNYFSIGVVSKTMAKVCILWCLSQFPQWGYNPYKVVELY